MNKTKFKFNINDIVTWGNAQVPCKILSRRLVYEECSDDKEMREEYFITNDNSKMVMFWAEVKDLKIYKD